MRHRIASYVCHALLVVLSIDLCAGLLAAGELPQPRDAHDVCRTGRSVPLFQYAAFYNKDLEILPGPRTTLAGPIHTNGDLYLGTVIGLMIDGRVTAAGRIYNGRKHSHGWSSPNVLIYDTVRPRALPAGNGRLEITEADVAPWNGRIRTSVEVVGVPAPEALDPVPGSIYWSRADLRVVLNLSGGSPAPIEVREPSGAVDPIATELLAGCAGAVDQTLSMHNRREGNTIQMLEIDVQAVLDCVDADSAVMGGRAIDDATQGGLVWHFSVIGPHSEMINNYGVRVKNAAEIASTDPTAPRVKGLTVVTDQAIYIQGDYNSVDKKPAAFLSDSLNVLSNNWSDDEDFYTPIATSTTINAAFLAGTDSSGGVEGSSGQDRGLYNGGLENYPRFHERWTSKTLTYRGSFVSLNLARHVDGLWEDQNYSPPLRDWDYEPLFDDARNLPPMTPHTRMPRKIPRADSLPFDSPKHALTRTWLSDCAGDPESP